MQLTANAFFIFLLIFFWGGEYFYVVSRCFGGESSPAFHFCRCKANLCPDGGYKHVVLFCSLFFFFLVVAFVPIFGSFFWICVIFFLVHWWLNTSWNGSREKRDAGTVPAVALTWSWGVTRVVVLTERRVSCEFHDFFMRRMCVHTDPRYMPKYFFGLTPDSIAV